MTHEGTTLPHQLLLPVILCMTLKALLLALVAVAPAAGAGAADLTLKPVSEMLAKAAEATPPDFSHKDLSNLDLSDLAGAALAGADLDEAVLSRVKGLREPKGLELARNRQKAIY